MTSKSHDGFFPYFSKEASELSSLTSASLKAIVTGRRTRCTKCWSNFTLKCYANTSVKVDTRIEVECRQTISYLKGYSYLKLYCKKQSNQKPTANTVSTTRRTTLCWVLSNIKELLFIKLTLYLSPLFWKQILTKQNIASTKNSQEFLASQVPVLKRNKATNSSTSNHPFFSCNELFIFGNLFTLLRLTITFARAVCCWG